MRWVWVAAVAACSGPDRVAELDGSWAGAASIIDGSHLVYARFTYEEDGGYLSGQVLVEEPPGDRIYDVRRAETVAKTITLDLLQSDGPQALDLDGSLEGGTFDGTITMTVDCGEPAPCGWKGPVELTPSEPYAGLGPVPTPTEPEDTGPVVPTGDTAPQL
ncbi:MAG: hypothetical protein KTR31_18910 [Myxococcales bacterium]|nr:hypothetical protein [Myxococcales bacterium]